MALIVIVCGDRDYGNREKVFSTLDALHAEEPVALLRHGCAPGADGLADEWARMRGVKVAIHRADWSQGRKAGPIRNQAMVDAGADLLVAFPGDRGTADCTRRAKAAGIRALEVTP